MDENIFISWSKPRAQALGNAIKGFITDVIQTARPWMSDEDIEKGTRWNSEIVKQLDRLKVGIICLTPENLDSRWINFESGSLARTLGEKTCVCPYLLGLGHTDVGLPLSQFNVTVADEADTFRLIRTLNEVLGANVDGDRLQRTFDKFWPTVATEIDRIRQLPTASHPHPRDTPDILNEVVNRLQAIERQVDITKSRLVDWPAVRQYLLITPVKMAGTMNEVSAQIIKFQSVISNSAAEPHEKLHAEKMLLLRKAELEQGTRIIAAMRDLLSAMTESKLYTTQSGFLFDIIRDI